MNRIRTSPAGLALALVVAVTLAHGYAAVPQAPSPFEGGPAAPRNRIDQLVFARLARLKIEPARLSSDATFLRRVCLDTIGTLPTAEEARAFLADADPNKRAALIDRLLQRDEFADYWAMRWSDVLRVKSEFPINLWPNAVQAYHRWIRTSLRDGLPYDRFARALLTESGSNFRVGPVNFYRAVQGRDPEAIASAVALAFMGERVQNWPKSRLAGMAAFFTQVGYKATGEWKEEIVFFDEDKPAPRGAVFPDGTPARLAPGQDPREAFANWLLAPGNRSFAKAAVNRVWSWLVGRGIVHEADDLRPDNPPVNPELLEYLEQEFVRQRYDLRSLCRVILNSATYQLSPVPRSVRAEAAANFAYAIVRPLDAEVLMDAICTVTGTAAQYSSAIPEPYTFVPPDVHSIALPDASITSTFLETFGRAPRDTGLLSERANRPTTAQRLYLLNGSDIQRRIQQGPALQALLRGADGRQAIENLYVAILSRFPTAAEVAAIGDYGKTAGGNRRAIAIDVAWALLNSAEFRFRH